MTLVDAIVRLDGPAPGVAAKLMAVPPIPVIVPELMTLPFVGAPKPTPASLNTIPAKPVMVPLLSILALLPTRTPERAVPIIMPEFVSVVVFWVLTPSNAPEIVPELLTAAVAVAMAIPLVLVALIVAPVLLVIFANPMAPIACTPTPPTPVAWMVPPRLLVMLRLSPSAPRPSAVMFPELMIVAAVAETPTESAPIPCTVPEFVNVLPAAPPKLTPAPPCTVPPDCTVTPTAPVPLPVPIPVPVFVAAIVLVPLTVILMPPVPELLMFSASPLPVLEMLPAPE